MSRAYAYEVLRKHDTQLSQKIRLGSFDHAEFQINKKPRLELNKVKSVREMSSVMMTSDGLLIAFREGILPKPWPLNKPFNNIFDECEDETQHLDETPAVRDKLADQSNIDISRNEKVINITKDDTSFYDSLPKYLRKSKYSQYLQNYLSIPSPVTSKYFKRPVSNVSVNKTTKPSNQKHVNSQVTLSNKLKLKKLAKPLTNSVILNENRTLNGVIQIKMQEKECDKKFNEESSNFNKYSSEYQTNNTGPIKSKPTKPVSASTTPTTQFTSPLKSPTVSFPDTNRKLFVEEKRDLEVLQEEMDSLIVLPKIDKSATDFFIEKEKIVNNKEALDFNSEMNLILQEAVVSDDESEFLTCVPMSTILPLKLSADTMTNKPSPIAASKSVISQEIETETLNDVKSKPHIKDKKNKSGTIRKKDKKDKRKDLKEKKYKVYSNKNHDQNTDCLVPKITIKINSINSNTSISSEPTPELSQPSDKASGPPPTPFYLDDQGNRIWVCPACVQPDDGSPMIGCDSCDDWYHWVCVGIMEDPGATVDWFCKPCLDKRNGSMSTDSAPTGKKPGKKVKAHKAKH